MNEGMDGTVKRGTGHQTERALHTYCTCMTIAGSDPSGGAGIEADLKTFAALGCYGQAAITALTVQNTQEVKSAHAVDADLVKAQIETVWEDWMPDAVKIGMTGTTACIHAIACLVKRHEPQGCVLDPVMVSSSGYLLMSSEAADALVSELMPLCNLITPNLPELRKLLQLTGCDPLRRWQWREGTVCPQGFNADVAGEMARCLSDCLGGCSVLVKGGHAAGDANDVLWYQGKAYVYSSPRVVTSNTHGTGCTLSSAIAAMMARGECLPDAVGKAKNYLTQCLQNGAEVWAGHGNGAMNHFFAPQGALFQEKLLSLH